MRFYPRQSETRRDALLQGGLGDHGVADVKTIKDRLARYGDHQAAIAVTGTATFNESDVVHGSTKASQVLTLTPGAIANDKVIIGTTYYVFAASISDASAAGTSAHPWQVKVGASDTLSLANLRKAINATGVAGTDYNAALTAHPTVTSTASGATTLTVQAKTAGTAGNAIATTVTVVATDDGLAWAAVTLAGGYDAVALVLAVGGNDAFVADAVSARSATLIAAFPTTDGIRAALAAENFALSADRKSLTVTLPAIGAYSISGDAAYDVTLPASLFQYATATQVVTAALNITNGA